MPSLEAVHIIFVRGILGWQEWPYNLHVMGLLYTPNGLWLPPPPDHPPLPHYQQVSDGSIFGK
jgi:hypothetical protein